MFTVEMVLREEQPRGEPHVYGAGGTDRRWIVAVRIVGRHRHQFAVHPFVTLRLVEAPRFSRGPEAGVMDAQRLPDFFRDQVFPAPAGARFDDGAEEGVTEVRIGELAHARLR